MFGYGIKTGSVGIRFRNTPLNLFALFLHLSPATAAAGRCDKEYASLPPRQGTPETTTTSTLFTSSFFYPSFLVTCNRILFDNANSVTVGVNFLLGTTGMTKSDTRGIYSYITILYCSSFKLTIFSFLDIFYFTFAGMCSMYFHNSYKKLHLL